MTTGGVYHETVASQLAAPLPELHKVGGFTNRPRHSPRISELYLSEWNDFENKTIEFIERLKDSARNSISGTIEDLTVPRVDAPQHYLIGQEDSVKGKISSMISEPLNRIVIAARELPDVSTELAALRFGDFKCLGDDVFAFDEPDMVIVKESPNSALLRAVVEIKTFWTCDLDSMPIDGEETQRMQLGAVLGQLCNYMNLGNRKYGVFSTYRATLFVKRTDMTEFAVTRVVHHDQQNPSLRESFLYFMSLLPEDFRFGTILSEANLFRSPVGDQSPRKPGSPKPPNNGGGGPADSSKRGKQESKRSGGLGGYTYALKSNKGPDAEDEEIDGETSIITDEEGVIVGMFKTHSQLDKRVFKGEFITPTANVLSVMKVFAESDNLWYKVERNASDRMKDSRYTPDMLAYGITKGSFSTPGGHVVVKTFCTGEKLSNAFWDAMTLSSDDPILEEVRNGLRAFREKDIIIVDLRRWDLLWDSQAKQVFFVDLESCELWDTGEVSNVPIKFELWKLVDNI
ncbi:hypothetical protein ABW21_db0201097 [Orbilia brochopaga]|nr:hypothetical protein ABW21_db0201097 [Drechslerella brochopaga]